MRQTKILRLRTGARLEDLHHRGVTRRPRSIMNGLTDRRQNQMTEKHFSEEMHLGKLYDFRLMLAGSRHFEKDETIRLNFEKM